MTTLFEVNTFCCYQEPAPAQKLDINQKPICFKSGIFNILKSFRAKNQHAQFARLWEPLLLSSLTASPAVRNQLLPASSFHSRCVWHSCRDGESRHTSIQCGDLMCCHQILKIQPPPYLTPPTLLPLNCNPAAEKYNCSLNNCCKQPPSHNSQTQLQFHFNSQSAEFLFKMALATY